MSGAKAHFDGYDATTSTSPMVERSAVRVVFPEPHHVELEELTVRLDDLGPHEVVVRARRSVISPGTELAYYRGDSLGGVILGAQRPGSPFYPGYAMVGRVIAAGAECEFATGSSVLSHTPHQSVMRFDRRERVCVSLPEELNLDIAPFARLAQVGAVSLQLAVARPGDAVAVVGLGPIGNLVAQLASVSGYRVVGVDRSRERRDLARSMGLRIAVPPEEALEALPETGAKLVLECSGSAAAVVMATEICAPHGEVMTVGAPWRAEPEVPASAVVARVFQRYLSLRSGSEWQVPLYGEDRSVASCTNFVLDRLSEGSIVTSPLVSGIVSPNEMGRAYQLLDTAPEHNVTFLVDWESA